MRRRVVQAPAYPEPPVHLRRCVVEEVLTPEQIRLARAQDRDLLAAAFIVQRDALREWAQAHDVPWGETTRYRRRPCFRSQLFRAGGRR